MNTSNAVLLRTCIALWSALTMGGCAGPDAEAHPNASVPVGVCAPEEATSPPPPVARPEPRAEPAEEGCGDANKENEATRESI